MRGDRERESTGKGMRERLDEKREQINDTKNSHLAQ